MKSIFGCKVLGFGAKANGFVLEVVYDERDYASFIIKQHIRQEVSERIIDEEFFIAKLCRSDVSMEELIKLSKMRMQRKGIEDAQLMISAAVIHEMYVRRML